MEGIYCYTDLKTNKIVYVGKDSNIHINKRHKDHMKPSSYNRQLINRVLQNNPNRYAYKILKQGNFSQNLLNVLEILYIKRYNPLFNFTIGGDGSIGYKHSKEIRKKMSENHADMSGKNNPFYGKTHSDEVKKRFSELRSGENSYNWGKPHSKTHRINLSKSQNTSGYFRVSKIRSKDFKQGFIWRYMYYDEKGNRKAISSIDIKKLEEKVKSKGLDWFVLESND